ncbi:hypothetical protein VH441_02665 [Psychrobacter sp. HD31]|uniref:hypothetical protein n=1 Tax=Psychrobacter sp. HD31 TaxID=3112003 RepID=UPI003DA5E55F
MPNVGAAGGIGRITYAQHASPNRAELTDSALRGNSTNYSGNIKIVQGTVSIADTDKYGRVVSSAVGIEISGSTLAKVGGIATGGSKGKLASTKNWGFEYNQASGWFVAK